MWNKAIGIESWSVKLLRAEEDGYCLVISVSIGLKSTIVVNVYFQCAENSPEYTASMSRYIGFIESVLVEYSDSNSNIVIVLGDFNIAYIPGNYDLQSLSGFMKDVNLICCDDLSNNIDTYYNVSLKHSSCIDHVFVDSLLWPAIESLTDIDTVVNHSDHRPIVCQIKLGKSGPAAGCLSDAPTRRHRPSYTTRWDKANIGDYYKKSYKYLQHMHASDFYFLQYGL